MPLIVFWYIVLQLLDCCAHDGVGFAVLQDIYLTIAEKLLGWVSRVDIFLWSGCRYIRFVDGLDGDDITYKCICRFPTTEGEASNLWGCRDRECE